MASELNRLNATQRTQVQTFSSFTESSELRALQYMKKFKWNLDEAVNDFFQNPPVAEKKPKLDEKAIENLFEKYAGKGSVEMNGEGFTKFFNDINVDLSDVLSLAVAWQLRAKTIGEFSKEEFTNGFKRLNCSSLTDIKERVSSLRAELQDDRVYKEFYLYVFEYAKGPVEQKKKYLNWTLP